MLSDRCVEQKYYKLNLVANDFYYKLIVLCLRLFGTGNEDDASIAKKTSLVLDPLENFQSPKALEKFSEIFNAILERSEREPESFDGADLVEDILHCMAWWDSVS